MTDFRKEVQGLNEEEKVAYWNEITIDLNKEEKITYALKFVSDSFFYLWKPILDDLLCNAAPTDGYRLLRIVIQKMGTGLPLENFLNKCKTDKQFSISYITHIDDDPSKNSASYSGLIRALSFNERGKPWSNITQIINSQDQYTQLCGSYTLRFLANNDWVSDFPPSPLDSIFKIMSSNNDIQVRENLVWYLIPFYNPLDPRFVRVIENIFDKNSDLLKLGLFILSTKNRIPLITKFSILERISNEQGSDLVQSIILCLFNWGKENIQKSLHIIRNLSFQDGYLIPPNVVWVIEGVCSSDIMLALSVVDEWIAEDIDQNEIYLREHFFYPSILVEITKTNPDFLVNYLGVHSLDGTRDNFVIYTVKEYLDKIPRRKNWAVINISDKRRLDLCVESLKRIAVRKDKDSSKFPNKNIPVIIQCGKLIELIEQKNPVFDSRIIKKNFKRFANIYDFISITNNFEQEEFPRTCIFELLSRECYDYSEYMNYLSSLDGSSDGNFTIEHWNAYDALHAHALLSHLDKCLSRINATEPGTREIREKLMLEDKNQFHSALSELEIIGRLRTGLDVDIAAEINVINENGVAQIKKPDLVINFESGRILVEVITPQMAPILRYLGGGIIPNRLTSKLTSELKKHFKGQIAPQDAIILIDTRYSEISEWSAISSMYGTPSVQILFDEASRKVFSDKLVPAKDSISEYDSEASIILGIIIYKDKIDQFGNLNLIGRFYPNPRTKSPKKIALCKKIELVLLDELIKSDFIN